MRLLAHEPIGVAKFNRNRQFTRPFCQVRPQGIRVLWGKMRRQLDERRPEAIAECKQACDEVIRRALTVVEAAKMRDDLWEFGTKPESLGRRICPLLHFRFAVNAVMGRIELNGPKVSAISLREQPTRRPLWVG